MFDMLSNYKFGYFQQAVSDAAGAAANAPDDDGVDLWADVQLPNSLLILADVGSVGTDADFITVAQIDEAGLYLIEVYDPNRYVRVNVTVGTDAVVWSCLYMTYENQRRPVTQVGTKPTLTYGTDRVAKVAS